MRVAAIEDDKFYGQYGEVVFRLFLDLLNYHENYKHHVVLTDPSWDRLGKSVLRPKYI